MSDPTTTPTPTSTTKPGWQTSEFWLSVVAVVMGTIAASDALPAEGGAAKITALITSALVALGYTGARLAIKKKGE